MNRLIALQAETVIVADDHPLFRTAIKEALEAEQGETNFLEASSFESLQKLVDQQQEVDLVLLDLHMPGVSGFAGLVYLCKRYPSVPVVIISANEDPVVIKRALEHGAARADALERLGCELDLRAVPGDARHVLDGQALAVQHDRLH